MTAGEVHAGTGEPASSTPLKVVFVLPFPPTTDFHRKFFVDEIAAAGIATEYWDIADVMGYDMKFTTDHTRLLYRRIATLSSLAQAVAAEAARTTVFIVQVTRGVESFGVYRVFTKARATIALFGRGYLPSPAPERSPAVLLTKILQSRSVPTVAMSIVSRILRGAGCSILQSEVDLGGLPRAFSGNSLMFGRRINQPPSSWHGFDQPRLSPVPRVAP